ncbi:LegC family aminotransferase [Labilibacter marinus]|uniref:LegC family aminotransferase n=1 Tax=Labilibacter marinus TaxID=1477105 RepID=UPI00094F4F99|nr:LegC family aminotransferase [Labilibacter marinus]
MANFKKTIQYIRQVFNEPEAFIPLHAPVFSGNEKKYLNECIDTTFVSSVGKFVDQFETKIAIYTGSTKAVACVNGTNALHLALVLSGVEQNHEVITQPLTFIATANAISYCGAKPVFVDVDKETMGLSPDALRAFLNEHCEIINNNCINKTTGNTIKACVPMHTFGHPCRIDEIKTICEQFHIALIEDAAESLGSYYKSKHTGTFAPIGILSFNGNKTITTGGGGMLLFNDEALATRAKHLSTQAKTSHPWAFLHDEIGYNYRMPNINAAIGLAQLEKLNEIIKAKRKLAHKYAAFFTDNKIDYFVEPKDAQSNYWLNCLVLKNKEERDSFLEETNKKGVMTRPVWELINRLPMFQNCMCGDLSNTEWLADRVVNIPSSSLL